MVISHAEGTDDLTGRPITSSSPLQFLENQSMPGGQHTPGISILALNAKQLANGRREPASVNGSNVWQPDQVADANPFAGSLKSYRAGTVAGALERTEIGVGRSP